MTQKRPEGHQRIIPMLSYDDAPAAIAFLCEAFGFEETYRLDMPDGSIGHAELSHHDNVLMVATTWKAAGMANPQDLGGVHGQVHVYVDDVDAHFEKAKAAGATIAAEPADQFHGARSYRAVDQEGHRWMFACQVREPEAEDS